MRIDILTLFPELFKGVFDTSILKKATKKNLVQIFFFTTSETTVKKKINNQTIILMEVDQEWY